jgi:hypothetical protein
MRLRSNWYMKMHRLCAFVKCLVLVVVASANDALVLTEQDCGKSFALSHHIELRLIAVPSAGYDWYFINVPKHIKIEKHCIRELNKLNHSIVGAQIERKFFIDTTGAAGNLTLAIEYKRSWEKEVAKTCVLSFIQNNIGVE